MVDKENSIWAMENVYCRNAIFFTNGKVRGSNDAVYDVTIDTVHSKKSVCNCPFVEGRRVIRKHMVALNLGIFPEKEQQMMDDLYYKEDNQTFDTRMTNVEYR